MRSRTRVQVCLGLFASSTSSSTLGDAGNHLYVRTDSGAPDVAGQDADNDAEAADGDCNSVEDLSQPVKELRVPAAAPTPMGGPIVDGTYVSTAAAIYTGDGGTSGPSGNGYRVTDVVSGQSFQLFDNSVPPRVNGTFAVDGSAFSTTITCPSDAKPFAWVAYDSDGTKVTLYGAPGPAGVKSLTLTKR
jgi:hypothetical protein